MVNIKYYLSKIVLNLIWNLIKGVGDALNPNSVSLKGLKLIQSITPNSGSINGGTVLTIVGNGFDESSQVTLDTANCRVLSKSIDKLTCETTAHSTGTVSYSIKTLNQTYSTTGLSYVYDQLISPVVSSVNPTHGTSGTLVITGSKFSTDTSK